MYWQLNGRVTKPLRDHAGTRYSPGKPYVDRPPRSGGQTPVVEHPPQAPPGSNYVSGLRARGPDTSPPAVTTPAPDQQHATPDTATAPKTHDQTDASPPQHPQTQTESAAAPGPPPSHPSAESATATHQQPANHQTRTGHESQPYPSAPTSQTDGTPPSTDHHPTSATTPSSAPATTHHPA